MIFNPREAALKSLVKWEESGAFSNIEVNTVISRANAPKNDASLYTLLFLGVIEKKLLLDHIIKKYSCRPLDELDTVTKNILRLGIYQLAFTEKIPEYSATDESVNLANNKTKGFINAILRSFIRDGKKIPLPNDKWEKISLEYSVPMELCKLFVNSYGEDIASEICTLPPQKSSLSLRVNTLKASVDDVVAMLEKIGAETIKSTVADSIIKTDASISDIERLLNDGVVFVQDESSRIASRIVDARPNDRVLDACACPGGKSFSIAIDMENKGTVSSCDLHQSKLSLITKGAVRLGIDIIEARCQNGKEYVPEWNEKFDRVLCDVPCSGLGVIFKKPDIKYKPVSSYSALPSVQYDILNNNAKYLKKGGVLVYSTCTLNSQENEQIIEKFLSENKDFSAYDFELGNIKSTKGGYTFLPHLTGTDGFFVARMRRNDD